MAFDYHRKLQLLVQELNRIYRSERALYEIDYSFAGFSWVDLHDVDSSIISFIRRAENPRNFLLFVCNFTPVPHYQYRLGVPEEGIYDEILNTDSELFGGSNLGNYGRVVAEHTPSHNLPFSLCLNLPPLAVVVFKPRR